MVGVSLAPHQLTLVRLAPTSVQEIPDYTLNFTPQPYFNEEQSVALGRLSKHPCLASTAVRLLVTHKVFDVTKRSDCRALILIASGQRAVLEVNFSGLLGNENFLNQVAVSERSPVLHR
jgi:hypothetical protein